MLYTTYHQTNLNIYFLQSLMYIFFLTLLLPAWNMKKNQRLSKALCLILIIMAGLPPSPLFFTKLWLLSGVSGFIPQTAAVLLIIFNLANMYTYCNFIWVQGNKTGSHVNSAKIPHKNTIAACLISLCFATSPTIFTLL